MTERYQKVFLGLIIQLFCVCEFVFPAGNKRYKAAVSLTAYQFCRTVLDFDGFRSINICNKTI